MSLKLKLYKTTEDEQPHKMTYSQHERKSALLELGLMLTADDIQNVFSGLNHQ